MSHTANCQHHGAPVFRTIGTTRRVGPPPPEPRREGEPHAENPRCAICLQDFHAQERVTTHRACGQSFHQVCLKEWIESTVGPHQDNHYASCPLCRGRIARYDGKVTEVTMTADNTTSAGLVNALTNGSRVFFVPRSTFANFGNIQGMIDFHQQHVRPQNGLAPSYTITARPGSEVFQASQATQAALLRVEVCDHERWWILLTAQQTFEILSTIFNHGWEPLFGTRVSRINLQAARGQPLAQIIHEAPPTVTEISAIELNYLFPGYPPFQRRERMHIRLHHNVPNSTNGLVVQTLSFQVNSTQTRGQIIGLNRTFQAFFELGAAPDGTDTYPLPDSFPLHLHQAFRLLVEPFPPPSQAEEGTPDNVNSGPGPAAQAGPTQVAPAN